MRPHAAADRSTRSALRLVGDRHGVGSAPRRTAWLDVADDRLRANTVRVVQGVQRIAGRLVLDELKSERSHRTLPLPRIAIEVLTKHRARQDTERTRADVHWAENRPVFCAPDAARRGGRAWTMCWVERSRCRQRAVSGPGGEMTWTFVQVIEGGAEGTRTPDPHTARSGQPPRGSGKG
jgi:hypothetical protein